MISKLRSTFLITYITNSNFMFRFLQHTFSYYISQFLTLLDKKSMIRTYIRGIERQPTPFVLSLKSVKVLLLCNSGFLQIQCEFMAKFHAQNGQKDFVGSLCYIRNITSSLVAHCNYPT